MARRPLLVAAGHLDAFRELRLHAWDVAAGLPIVEEAGGRTCDLTGHLQDATLQLLHE